MGLIEEFDAIAKQISQQQQWMTTEQATINVAIHPFIRVLGYDTNNLAEVRPEYTADAKSSGSERVDYAIMRDSAPIIFIEAKASNIVLNENHWKQLHHYFNAEEVRFGILTNGLEFRFYSDLKKRNIMDKEPFLTIDMLNLDERLVKELEGFTKSSFDAERILSSARKLAVVRLLENEYRQPTTEFAEYFARQVYPGRITQSVIEEFMPIFSQAWRQFIKQQIPSHPQPVVQTETAIAEHKAQLTVEETPTTFTAEYSRKIPVYAVWHGHSFEATLVFDESHHRGSRVTYNGLIATPSKTALKAIRSIVPDFKAINGWGFWKIRDPNGSQERRIGDLRNDAALVRRLQGKT